MDYREELLEPIKFYKYELIHSHDDKINAFFDNLTQQSNIDVEGNRLTCKEHYSFVEKANQARNKLNSNKGLRGFLIAMTIICFIVGTILPIASIIIKKLYEILIPIGVLLILLGVGLIIINSLVLSKRIEKYQKELDSNTKAAEEKKNLAYEQVAPLSVLFDWGIPAKIVTETTPIIQMDQNFTTKRCNHFVANYGWKDTNPDNVSAIFVQSGTVVGNPFMYERDYVQIMFNETYTGTLVITWTTYSVDSKGNTRAIHHTQTLVAHYVHPAARFFLDTALIYANEAAPHLSFSRKSSNANQMSEKEIEKGTNDFEKKLQKKVEKNTSSNFTPLGNTKFEYLFNALDRDNEVEFRLLFTPLAQKNMIEAITSKAPFGDDFSFTKKKMINVIRSSHAQTLSFDGNPYHYYSFDYDVMRNNFINYNKAYFEGIYYDFVPLLSIPLYQQHRDYDPKENTGYKGTVTLYEAEVLSNFMSIDIFKPEKCDTNLILKASFLARNGDVNIFNIHSYGFNKIPMTTIVPKVGGDGLTHGVPVHYFEYEKVEKDTPVVVMNVEQNREAYRQNKDRLIELLSKYSTSSDIIYQRGLLAFPLKEGISTIDGEEIKKLFSLKED